MDVAGDEVAAGRHAVTAGEVAELAASLAHEQAACGHVPGLQAGLEVAVQASCRDIGQIERRRTGAAQVVGLAQHRARDRELRVQVFVLARRESGAQDRAGKALAIAHAHAPVVEKGAVALARGEQLVAQRIVDHAVDEVAMIHETDRHREMRKAAQVVVRAVERIDDPDLVGFSGLAGFLAEDGVVGIGATQLLDDLGFGQLVDLADVVVARFFLDVEPFHAIDVAQDDVACGARGAHRDIDGGSGHDRFLRLWSKRTGAARRGVDFSIWPGIPGPRVSAEPGIQCLYS